MSPKYKAKGIITYYRLDSTGKAMIRFSGEQKHDDKNLFIKVTSNCKKESIKHQDVLFIHYNKSLQIKANCVLQDTIYQIAKDRTKATFYLTQIGDQYIITGVAVEFSNEK